MDRHLRAQFGAIVADVDHWVEQARRIMHGRADTFRAAEQAVETIERSAVDVHLGGELAWRVAFLRPGSETLLGHIAQRQRTPALSDQTLETLRSYTTEVARALTAAKASTGMRRLFAGRARKSAAERAAQYLWGLHAHATARGLPAGLAELIQNEPPFTAVDPEQALTPAVGLADLTTRLGRSPESVPADGVSALPAAVAILRRAIDDERRVRSTALQAGEATRRADSHQMLSGMPIDSLKDATRDRLRLGPLTAAGLKTVQDVLSRSGRLVDLPNVGPAGALRIEAAAQALRQTVYDETPVRIDVTRRTPAAAELLRALAAWDALRSLHRAPADLERAVGLTAVAQQLVQPSSHLLIYGVGQPTSAFRDAVTAVVSRAQSIDGLGPDGALADPWDDFLARPADYFAMLSELGLAEEDEQRSHGDLPDAIVEAVRGLTLETEHLTASLRGYQNFGARFALVQRKVIIGDEMGLGKTVEALAVLTHLHSRGQNHFLVLCPAAVITNWMREVESKSTLRVHRLHGPHRHLGRRAWIHRGGVAVTTYESLGWFEQVASDHPKISCVVVDEAHYLKNPAAKRTIRSHRLVQTTDHAVFLTGTPLENRLEEFGNLISYLRPDLVVNDDQTSPRAFRRQVAPAYLRRNQEDVLTELPELVEVADWLPMTAQDEAEYRSAVAAGNFMAMRQAALLSPDSAKLDRLKEIVGEAEANGRKVLVFSYFRDVLARVTQALGGQVFGPLTGSTPPAVRQQMVDEFTAAQGGAVLVAQIVAGGTGLNIQAASVVVLCEPQLKPTIEWQAIARARRMGQLDSVQAHRLLSEEGLDRRITEILANKSRLFADFARESDTADSAPEAFDVSEAELARQVVSAERARLFATPAEQPTDIASSIDVIETAPTSLDRPHELDTSIVSTMAEPVVSPNGGRRPRFAVLDVETTGLDANQHRIVEIAVVTTDDRGHVLDEWSTRLNPQSPVGATHIHGITAADVATAPTFADIAAAVSERLDGAAVAAHNANFDLAFVRAEFRRAGWAVPFLPAVCTLQASFDALPMLDRRRLADCCAAVDVTVTGAHSALGDARATAGLLASFLNTDPGIVPSAGFREVLTDALSISWPTGPTLPQQDRVVVAPPSSRRSLSRRALTNISAAAAAAATRPLTSMIEQFSLVDALDEGAPRGAVAYLEKLTEVLEDGVITDDEADDLAAVAAVQELDDADIDAANRAFVLALAHAALEDGKVTREERIELQSISDLLDVDQKLLPRLLDQAERARHERMSADLQPLPPGWSHGEPLRVGDKVAFTGCDGTVRDHLEARAEQLGVRVMSNVSSKTSLLVTDGSMVGTKLARSRQLGTRTVDPSTFADMLEHLQPTLPKSARTSREMPIPAIGRHAVS